MFSLVIRADEVEVKNYIESLKPLIEKFSPEIIIINNDIKSLEENDYECVIYEYHGIYEHFKEYCSSLCKNDLVMFIERGMILSFEFIDALEKELLYINRNYYISCNYKIYYGKDEYLKKRLPILVNKNKKAVEKFLESEVEDFSLLKFTKDDVEDNIWKLVNYDLYDLLHAWAKCIVRENSEIIKIKFFEALEKVKSHIPQSESRKIDDIFINGDFDNYSQYLNIRHLFLDRPQGFKNTIEEKIKDVRFEEKDIYAAYLIPLFMKDRELTIFFFESIGIDLTKLFISYLLSALPDFYTLLYDFMVGIDLPQEIKVRNNNRITFYKEITKIYIAIMADKSDDIEKRTKLIQMFVDYTNYGIYVVRERMRKNKNIVLNRETNFIMEIDRAIGKLSENELEDAIDILYNAAKIYPVMEKVILYYIQKLRQENEIKPYKLSICMIVKDEEKNLARCLDSVKPLVDCGMAELIIVDTGSEDNTLEIAKRYTSKVFIHPWQDSFSEARNYSISLANGEYIFIIDADEEIGNEEIQKLIDEFSSDEYKNFNTFTFKIKNYSDINLTRYSIITQPLIFKNDGYFYYSGTVHNQPIFKEPIKNLDITILHYGYIMTDDVKDKKFIRTSTLLKKELEKDPNNLYYRYQLSVSYDMHGDHDKALEHVKIYMKNIGEPDNTDKIYLEYYNNAARIYYSNALYDEVLKICDIALSVQPDFIDFIYYKAIALIKKEKYANSIEHIKKYLKLHNEFFEHEIANDFSFAFYTLGLKNTAVSLLLECCYKLKKYNDCVDLADEFTEIDIISNNLPLIIDSYFQTEQYGKLANFYIKCMNKASNLGEICAYFIGAFILKYPEKKERCISLFSKYGINYENTIKYSSANEIISLFKKYYPSYQDNIDELVNMKNKAEMFLKNTNGIFEGLKKEDIILVLDKYINICTILIGLRKEDLLDNKEKVFITGILEALEELTVKNIVGAVRLIKSAITEFEEMAVPMKLFLETILPPS